MSSDPSRDRTSRGQPSIPMRDLLSTTDNSQHTSHRNQHEENTNLHAPTAAQLAGSMSGLSGYWDSSYRVSSDDGASDSTIDPSALQAALPPDFHYEDRPSSPLDAHSASHYDNRSLYNEGHSNVEFDESDRVPLTSGAQPISRSLNAKVEDDQGRNSFQTVSSVNDNLSRGRRSNRLGEDLEAGFISSRPSSHGLSLDPNAYRGSRSSSTSGALHRAGDMVRAMSQRVVNISGESEVVDHRSSRHRSHSPHDPLRDGITSVFLDPAQSSQTAHSTTEKVADEDPYLPAERPISLAHQPPPNFFKGKSLGIFPSDSRIRQRLCDVLVHPYLEPLILFFIILQAILLVIGSAPNVFSEGNERGKVWGVSVIDWIMLGLFVIFTLELMARIIVSGFFFNAAEYSSIDRKRGVKAAIADQYRAVFQPQRHKSIRGVSQLQQPSAIARSFTTIMGGQQALPKTLAEQQRFQLARRAFLRHSFNRLDFVAVVSFWIGFVMSMSGLEEDKHLYLFKMLSCLRILRLLALTHGTAIILRSLKKATPLLVRVAFLVSFFWLLFAIIGVQSFKSSFRRQCTWLDPNEPTNLAATFTHDMQFCGGYVDAQTNTTRPWVKMDTPGSLEVLITGTHKAKGYICPIGLICLEQDNPYNGTVNFDNIFNSLEMVFVIMSANTFSDLMYYTMASDYMQAALFFGAGSMILTLWLTNLLIAVITSSFQVIREESKASAFAVDHEHHSKPDDGHQTTKKPAFQRLYEKTRLVWLVVIAFGLLCQACRSASMSDFREDFIDVAEVIVTIVLDLEMVIRIAADRRDFHRSWLNLFDLGLAVITSIILIPPIRHSEAYPWLSIFQILRVYRVVLAIPVIRSLILLVLGNASGIANLMLFVTLMAFFMAIFAAQLFRGEIPLYNDGDLNEISFYTIYNSFLGMYQIMSSENWTDILYNVTAYTKSAHTYWIAGIFFVGWFILSFIILINMFIAVIQENFDVSEDEKRVEQVKSFLQSRELGHANSSNLALSTIFGFGRSRRQKDPLDYGPAMMDMLLKDAVVREFLDDQSGEPLHEGGHGIGQPQRTGTTLLGSDQNQGIFHKIFLKVFSKVSKKEPNPFYQNIKFDGPNDTLDPRQMARQAVSATSARRKAQREYIAQHPSYNHSLYFFPPTSNIRRACQRLVGPARGHERFDGLEPNKVAWYSFSAFIYASIVAMVVLACVTTPLYQKEYVEAHVFSFKNWYVWTDVAFAVLFTVEAIIKIIADGFLWTPNAYMRSSWGVMDFVVLITLWINVLTLFINDGAISRAIGAFKALRALRLLNVSNSARNTFHSLIIVGWWKILGAAFVSVSLLIPFAIYGLNLFHGALLSCNDGDGITRLDGCFGEYSSTPYSEDWPFLAPRTVSNPYFNFDDFGSSMFTLFQIVSQEGWIDVSFAVQAITGKGTQPQDLVAQGNALFVVAFNLLATVFILTLFISVFMRSYTEQTGVAFLTAEQRSWLELRKMLRQVNPSKTSYNETKKKWKKWCHKKSIEKRSRWYQFITVVLVFHLFLLVIEYDGEPFWWTQSRDFVFLGLTLIYIGNIAIRVIGLGWSRYRKSSWDLYAMASVGGAFAATIALLGAGKQREIYTQFHKVFLVSIVLLLIPRNDALDQLFKTAAASLTILLNLLATWLVMFLVFAIAMTQAFSLTRFGSQEDFNINFRTVPKALILLFRMSLGEGWNEVMEDFAAIEVPLCVDSEIFFDSDCGSKAWARFLFVAWNLVSMYIFVNLFVSLIYESFSYVYQRSSGVAAVDRDEIRRFKEAWRSVDPTGSGFISKDTFPRLLGELSGVFQMKIYDPEDSVLQIIDDVRNDTAVMSHHASVASFNTLNELDIDKLNERLDKLDVHKIRERRRRFKLFYGEVLVSADPDRGISFNSVLMILAHYNIINDSKSLKLDEFLKRRARLQRVEEEVRRKIVQGFFDTLYWSRKFRKHMEAKRMSRMTAVPQLDIPHIMVGGNDDEEEDPYQWIDRASRSESAWAATAEDMGSEQRRATIAPGEPATGLPSMDLPGDAHQQQQHPLSFPPSLQAPAASGVPTGFSFELYEPDPPAPSASGAELREQKGGAANAAPARGVLDDSAWGDSIRRSVTLKRPGRGSRRYGDYR